MKKILALILGACIMQAHAVMTDTVLKDFALNDTKISLHVPAELTESFVTSPENIFITYSSKDTAYSVIFKFSVLSKANANSLMQGDNFINTALIPYSDKDKRLYGEYKIVQSFEDKMSRSVLIDSYLTKQADEYLPEAYFKINEYISLKGRVLSTITCRATGARAQKHMIDSTFSLYHGMCSKIIRQNKELLDTAGRALEPKP